MNSSLYVAVALLGGVAVPPLPIREAEEIPPQPRRAAVYVVREGGKAADFTEIVEL